KRAVVGSEAGVIIEVRNSSTRRTIGGVLEVPVGDEVAEIVLPAVRRGASVTQEVEVPTKRRGIVSVGPVRTVRADPLGLVRRELDWTGRVDLVVHPYTVSVPSTSTGLIRDLEGSPTR